MRNRFSSAPICLMFVISCFLAASCGDHKVIWSQLSAPESAQHSADGTSKTYQYDLSLRAATRQPFRLVVNAPSVSTEPVVFRSKAPGESDAKYLQAYASAAKSSPNSTIKLPRGIYRIDFVRFYRLSNVVLDGSGSTLIAQKPRHLMILLECERVVVTGFNLKFVHTSRSLGTIVRGSGSSKNIAISSPHLQALINEFPEVYKRVEMVRIQRADGSASLEEKYLYLGRTKNDFVWNSRKKVFVPKAGDFIHPINSFPIGAPVIVWHKKFLANGVSILGGADVQFHGNTIYAPPGEGFYFQDLHGGAALIHNKVIPEPGTPMKVGAHGDCFRFNQTPNVIVKFNTCQYSSDDGLNFQSNFGKITKVSAGKLFYSEPSGSRVISSTRFLRRPTQWFTILDPTSLQTISWGRASGVVNSAGGIKTLHLVGALGAPVPTGSLIYFNSTSRNLYIKGNTFKGGLSRGMLIQGSNVVISDNTLENFAHAAVVIGPDASFPFWEAGPVDNALLLRNTIKSVNHTEKFFEWPLLHMGAVSILAHRQGGYGTGWVNRDINLSLNRFFNTPTPAIQVSSANKVMLYRNSFHDVNYEKRDFGALHHVKAQGNIFDFSASNVWYH